MTRPAFQFYPGDWQKNANLRRCSPAARGVWIDILCLFHDSEAEYGVLRWPLKDVANAAGAPMPLVRELVAKGVLKGADREAADYTHRPKHAGKYGDPVTLVTHQGGPVWYSSRMVKDEWARSRRGEGTRFDTENQPPGRSPTRRVGDGSGDGPSSSSSPSGSVPYGTGDADAPPPVDKSNPDPERRRLWREGGSMLVEAGLSEGSARALLARLAKEFPAVIREAVAATVAGNPVEPASYLVGACRQLQSQQAGSNTVPGETVADYLARVEGERQAEAAATPSPAETAEFAAKARADALRIRQERLAA